MQTIKIWDVVDGEWKLSTSWKVREEKRQLPDCKQRHYRHTPDLFGKLRGLIQNSGSLLAVVVIADTRIDADKFWLLAPLIALLLFGRKRIVSVMHVSFGVPQNVSSSWKTLGQKSNIG
jgi:hypothetical protein